MVLKNVILFLIVFILGGCSTDSSLISLSNVVIEPSEENIIVEKTRLPQEVEKKLEKEEKTQEEESALNVFEILQGKWTLVDNANDILEFSDWERIEHYEGKIISQDSFELFKNHPVRDGDKVDNTGMYMVVTFKEWDSEFNILMIDDHNLTMVHLFRGNILKYRR